MMRSSIACAALALAISCAAAQAQETLLYSFESGLDGFFGLGATVSADTIGATVGTTSLRYSVASGGFVGARTETVIPVALDNPPGVDYILFDLTIPTAYAGTFADIGVTVFGHSTDRDPASFGNQVQFGDTVSLAALAPGSYTNLRIDLDAGTNPFTFATQSFNQIFGPGADRLQIASAFQFFIVKNFDQPITVYIDNVRAGSVVPEPSTLALFGLGGVALLAYRRR